jgi:hypothetical protein
MRVNSSTRFAAMAALVGALACAGNSARDTDEAAAARDTTTTDTLNQNPPGYRGMERDTALAPPSEQQPSDTFLQNQGTGTPQDTSGYSGAERVDTTGQAQQGQVDTTSFPTDTTGAAGAAGDTTSMTRDSSWNKAGDTTGYNPTQQPGDSISR